MATRPELLSLNEVKARLRVRHAAVRELIAAGTLETLDVNGRQRITAASVDRYVGRLPVPAVGGVDPHALAGLFREFADRIEQMGAA